MTTILLALIQLIVASGIFYGYYHFFLRNKQFHAYNRFFLLAATCISLLIPFLHIPIYFSSDTETNSGVLQTLQQINFSGFEEEGFDNTVVKTSANSIEWSTIIYYAYLLIATLFLARIIASIWKISKIKRKNPSEKLDGIHFIITEAPGTPFSFFRWLFWDRNIELKSVEGEQIFKHEIFHIQQKHSWDVMFMELVTMIAWINPFFHLMKKELRAIHEFLADKFAATDTGKWDYAELLLMQAMQTRQPLTNPFFQNQIKRRIAMITNPQKTSHRYLRKVLALPVAAVLLTMFAFRFKELKNNTLDLSPRSMKQELVIVLDPGHGGMDPGAISPNDQYKESAISLEIAKQIQVLSSEYNVKVVMTRESDILPGAAGNKEDGLKNRVMLAKQIKPTAFLAIHINSNGADGKFQDRFSGFEAFVSGSRNDVKGNLLASSILSEISPLYKTSQSVQKRKSAGIFVLDANECPAIILQCGYINNSKDLSFITDKKNQEQIARHILQGLRDYADAAPMNNMMIPAVTLDTLKPVSKDKPTISEVKIEGATMLKLQPTAAEPIYVIDGVLILTDPKKSLDSIGVDRIASITVWKDEKAVSMYGEKGRNGVIEIGTKDNPTIMKLQEIPVDGKASGKVVIGHAVKPTELGEVVVVGYGNELKEKPDPIFTEVETPPAFIGEKGAWNKFLERNLNGNIAVTNNAPAGTYTVKIKFVVDKGGNIGQMYPLTNFGYGMEEEVMRVLKSGNLWKPAIQNGKQVSAWTVQPVTFVVDRSQKVTTL